MRELGHIERAGSRRGIGADTTCRSMRRRWLFALGAAALASPFAAFAQQSGKSPRVGFLYYGSRQSAIEAGRYPAFVEGMRDLGYVEGKNLVIESRYADGKPERVSAFATELARLKVEVIVATGSQTYRALQLATSTVPIVVTVGVDPVAGGYAATMARPGRNFTGLTDTAADLNPKLLELLMAVTSKLARLGVLLQPENASHPQQLTKLMLVAQKLGVQVVLAEAATADTIDAAFTLLSRERVNAVLLLSDSVFLQQQRQIAAQAIAYRLPSITAAPNYAQAGGLLCYGSDLTDNFRRAAGYVDKIIKGAKPGDLPFEQPTRYYLTINLKTAKALGLTIPQTLLVSADKVI